MLLIVASIPTAIIGFTVADFIETHMWNLHVASMSLCVTGTFLWFTKYIRPRSIVLEAPLFSYISVQNAFWIGLAQGFALIPGISRSGITITTALFLKTGRRDAASFSFILSIPAILGALCLKLLKTPSLSEHDLSLFLTGFSLSMVVGAFALLVLIRIVLNGKLYQFSWYCFVIGILSIFLAYF